MFQLSSLFFFFFLLPPPENPDYKLCLILKLVLSFAFVESNQLCLDAVVVLMSSLEESLGVVVILSWLTCQIVFVFKKCLVSCDNYWCLPSIGQYKVLSVVCHMPNIAVGNIMPIKKFSFYFLVNSTCYIKWGLLPYLQMCFPWGSPSLWIFHPVMRELCPSTSSHTRHYSLLRQV